MKRNFLSSLTTLESIANKFDENEISAKTALLYKMSKMALPEADYILRYHDVLMFLCAYPSNANEKQLVEKELKRITLYAKKVKNSQKPLPENEGLPFTNTVTRFSPDFLKWLDQHPDLDVTFDSFYNASLSLNDILNITLPAVLKAETTASLSNEDLLELLGIKPNAYVPFLLGQLDELKEWPLIQELFIERMDLYVILVPKNLQFSRAYNRITAKEVYHHKDLLKHFDHEQLINQPLPAVSIPSYDETQALYKAIKNSMALMVREIDPTTFMQQNTMRLYALERGLTFAIYTMVPIRQLPLETYFGCTFFKNGIPIAYGGIWVFGKMAKIGLNIFESFRGGESGYILCQLIRVLKQSMGVSYLEIEPFQIGLNNPGGISSGAFWFYYKFGFRPVDAQLKLLAEKEYRKIKSKKSYRSSSKTLLRFTVSNIGANLAAKIPLSVHDIANKILSTIKKDWQNNYALAKEKAITTFCKKVSLDITVLNENEKRILEEVALWAMAYKIEDKQKLQWMKQMVSAKTKDDYAYQQLLLHFFE